MTAFLRRATFPAKQMGQSGTVASHTGNTSATTVATVTIPGNTLGPNGYLDITWLESWTNNANNKTFWVKFGGTTFYGLSRSTGLSGKVNLRIHNRNSASSQVGQATSLAGGGWGPITAALATGTIDTTTAQDLIFQVQLANAADTGAFEAYSVTAVYGA